MPEKSKRRGRPVIEEIIEEAPKAPQKEPEVVRVSEEAQEKPSVAVETRAKALIEDLEKVKEESKMNMKLLFLITIITALIVGFITGGVYVYFTGLKALATSTPTPTSTPMLESEASPASMATPSPTNSPTPASVISSYKVSVLNGSGQAGSAGKVKALLENAGFKVASTGNATNFSYASTQIQTIDSIPSDVVSLIKKTLSTDYSVEVGKNLPAGSKSDIVITVGSK